MRLGVLGSTPAGGSGMHEDGGFEHKVHSASLRVASSLRARQVAIAASLRVGNALGKATPRRGARLDRLARGSAGLTGERPLHFKGGAHGSRANAAPADGASCSRFAASGRRAVFRRPCSLKSGVLMAERVCKARAGSGGLILLCGPRSFAECCERLQRVGRLRPSRLPKNAVNSSTSCVCRGDGASMASSAA